MVSINFANFFTVGLMALIFWAIAHWLVELFGVSMPGFREHAHD